MKYYAGDKVAIKGTVLAGGTNFNPKLPYRVVLSDGFIRWFNEKDLNAEAHSKAEQSAASLEEAAESMATAAANITKEEFQFASELDGITQDLKATLAAKNHDYGNAFHDSIQEFGDVVMIIRLNDKINRLKTLINNQQEVEDESIEDTLRDIAGYAILSLMEFK